MEFHEQNPLLRDKYQIVTVHGPGAKNYAELAPHLIKLEKDVWKKAFPFPILFDSSLASLEAWGIRAFPTVVLIDPEGNVVRNGSLETLKARLGVAKAEGK